MFASTKPAESLRRRIKTEKMAEVVADAWGAELLQFLAALAIVHMNDLKNRRIAPGRNEEYEFISFFKLSWCKIASATRN